MSAARKAVTGIVYLVGAGPGAPDLLTLRAANLLARADIVFHDALVHPDTLALAARAEKIAVGKRCGKHSTVQRFINKRLIDAAQGRRPDALRARPGRDRGPRSGGRPL
jgi:uroporphyrin-III C-methyltransferase